MITGKRNKLSFIALAAVILTTFAFGGSVLAAGADLSGFKNSIVLLVGSPNTLEKGASKQIDAANPSVVPYIDNGRTMIPLSYVGSSLGFKVTWNEANKRVLLEKSGLTLEFTLNSRTMKNNGKAVFMDTAAVSRNGRTFVPVAYIAQAMGVKASYDRGLVILDAAREFTNAKDKDLINAGIAALSGLPVVGSAEKLAELITTINSANFSGVYYSGGSDVMKESASSLPATSAPMAADSARGAEGEFSQTNTQVQGVDESDVVKTDGKYIYHLSGNTFRITNAYPAKEMKVLSEIKFGGESGSNYASEMYLDGDRLIVLSIDYVMTEKYGEPGKSEKEAASDRMMYAPVYGTQLSKVSVYDITDRSKPVIERVFSIEGYTIASRKIGDMLYLVANQYIYSNDEYKPEDYLPVYYDSLLGRESKKISASDMRYFPGTTDSSIMMIAGINVADAKKEVNISSYLGSGSTIYMSENALYVAKYGYEFSMARSSGEYTNTTSVFRFILETGTGGVIASGSAVVDGSVLNQFSMDEYNGFFRIATTVFSNSSMKNQLTVFDGSMTECGRISDMAPGERIYSARFMGDRAFMVTYRQVDPLFAIDLVNPYSPKVLGELKIPGYSTYLHPYDENHLIGFGQDTQVITSYNEKGEIYDQRTINNGLKLALFDISDMSNPKEKSVVKIGHQYSYSELLYNHKAFLFSKEKGIVAFPVQSSSYTDFSGKTYEGFQGAYVFSISENGISERGTVTQLNDMNDIYSNYSSFIERLLFIGDTLYSTSQTGIQANDMNSLQIINKLAY